MIIDPRKSYILDASAGSGKTFQLALRFLSLVAAGAAPESILTITFTRKAALEMKQRILAFAVKLNQDEGFRKLFISLYPQDLQMTGPVLQMVSQKIVDSASRLRVMTMDSLFFEWLQMYQYDILKDHFIYDFEVLSSSQSAVMQDAAWKTTLEKLLETSHDVIDEMMKNVFQKRGFFELRTLMESLLRFDHHLYQCLQAGRPLLEPFEIPELGDIDPVKLNAWHQELCKVASPALLAKLEKCSVDNLAVDYQKNKLYTLSKESLSGTYFRKKFRDSHPDLCQSLESYIRSYHRREMLQKLNQRARLLEVLYGHFQAEFSANKLAAGQIEFGDFVKYAKNLWANASTNISQFFIMERTKHLLIDEFQDTSRLQWAVFEPMVQELFAGLGSDNELASVFIVGDIKQSIYGFREAEPRMMDEIKRDIPLFESLSMSKSYRTSPVCLSFINQVFSSLDLGMRQDFPDHQTSPIVLDKVEHGSVWVEELETEGLVKEEKIQLEADKIALKIKEMIGNPAYQCCDSETLSYRELRPDDFLIVYRSATHTPLLESALFAQDLGVSKDIGKYFFDDLDVENRIKQIGQELVMVSEDLNSPESSHLLTSPYSGPYLELVGSLQAQLPFQSFALLSELSKLKEHPEGLRENQTLVDHDSVRMMSIHQSKGLEAPVVIVFGASEPWFKQDHYWRKDFDQQMLHYVGTKVEQPSEMKAMQNLQEQAKLNATQEAARLLYVALTRTQHHLIAFGYEAKDGLFPKLLEVAQNRQETWNVEVPKKAAPTPTQTSKTSVHQLHKVPLRTFQQSLRHLLPHRYVKATETKSNLNQKDSQTLGTLVHLILELILKEQLTVDEASKKAHLQMYIDPQSKLGKLANKMVSQLIAHPVWQELFENAQSVDCELPFSFLDQATFMRGKIDLLIHHKDNTIHVIDYKTAHTEEKNLENLKLIVHEQGVHLQLKAYQRAVQTLFKPAKIKASVLHVPSCQLIELK